MLAPQRCRPDHPLVQHSEKDATRSAEQHVAGSLEDPDGLREFYVSHADRREVPCECMYVYIYIKLTHKRIDERRNINAQKQCIRIGT